MHAPQQQRGYWSAEEDFLLSASVKRNGRQNWAAVAAELEGRGSKQCRERWLNYLRNDIQRGPWTEFEKEELKRLHNELGNKWTNISRHLGRAENDVKNFAYNYLRQKLIKTVPCMSNRAGRYGGQSAKRHKAAADTASSSSLSSSFHDNDSIAYTATTTTTTTTTSSGRGGDGGAGSGGGIGGSPAAGAGAATIFHCPRQPTHRFLLQRFYRLHQQHLTGGSGSIAGDGSLDGTAEARSGRSSQRASLSAVDGIKATSDDPPLFSVYTTTDRSSRAFYLGTFETMQAAVAFLEQVKGKQLHHS